MFDRMPQIVVTDLGHAHFQGNYFCAC